MMLRRTHWWTAQRPLFGHAQPTLDSDVVVFASLEGTSADDFIKGTEGEDTIEGLAGNDMLKGQGGDDVIHGGDGNDQVFGGDGGDILYGDGGNDEIRGGDGDDHIIGGKDYDTIYGGVGENVIESTTKDSVYTIAGGVDHVATTRYWNVDYSLTADGLDIDNNGLRFSNGTSAQRVISFRFLLGSGDDSFKAAEVIDQGSSVNAGGGYDHLEITDSASRSLPIILQRGSDGLVTLSLYKYSGNKIESQYQAFENFHIVSSSYLSYVKVDGSLLYQGIHADFEIAAARIYIDFSTYDGQVTALYDASTMTINGSTFKGSAYYAITLNDQDGRVTAAGSITGGAGSDTLTGLQSGDYIYGNGGVDAIDGGGGDDSLDGGGGDDAIHGSAGVDRIYGQAGVDTIDGGDGNDTIDGGEGDDTIQGGLGDDTIVASAGHNSADGGAGDDTITGGDDDETLNGATGVDQIDGGLGHNTINGGDGDDILVSSAGAIDAVDGGGGSDCWSGSDYATTESLMVLWDGGLHVTDRFDVINTETVSFGLGKGDDLVRVSATSVGTLSLYDNGGDDTIDYSALTSGGITLSLAESEYQDTGAGGTEAIYGFENVIGTAKGDTLTGTDGANLLTGGGGADTLTGGAGADTFIVTGLADLGRSSNIDKIDRIADFSHTEGDAVDLTAIDADPNTAGDQAFDFAGSRKFDVGGTGPGEIRFSQSIDGFLLVQGDVDHDGKADFSFLVHNTALVASDFVL